MTLKMDDRKMGTGPAFFGISIFHLQTSVVLNFPTTVLLGPPFSINPSLFTALPHEKQYAGASEIPISQTTCVL